MCYIERYHPIHDFLVMVYGMVERIKEHITAFHLSVDSTLVSGGLR